MTKLLRIVLLIYIGLILFVLFDFAKGNEVFSSSNKLQRPKRYLAFLNVSHFFLRLNFKANMVPWNQIFAQAVGFRMNWDDPPQNFRPHHHIYRRSLYKHLEVLMDRNSLSGFDCLRRAICELDMISKPRGVYHKILKIIFRRQSQSTNYWHNATSQDCEQSIASCPFSILEVSLFTDI